MSQGIFKAIEKLEDMIEAITPKTDAHHGFIAISTGMDAHNHLINVQTAQDTLRLIQSVLPLMMVKRV